MADPVRTELVANTWKKVATGTTGGTITAKVESATYYYVILDSPSDDPSAPTDSFLNNLSVRLFKLGEISKTISDSVSSDIWVKPVSQNGALVLKLQNGVINV